MGDKGTREDDLTMVIGETWLPSRNKKVTLLPIDYKPISLWQLKP